MKWIPMVLTASLAFFAVFIALPLSAAGDEAVLDFSITANQTVVSRPGSLQLTMTVKNSGQATAVNVRVTDNLPLGWVYGDATIPDRFADLGNIEPNRGLTLIVPITITNRSPLQSLAYEAVASAANAAAVESFAVMTVSAGQVLGAVDQLPETGQAPPPIHWLLGGSLLWLGGIVWRRYHIKKQPRRA